jgi:CubicO group peptidase (beta-lactamase class C family)
MDDRVLTEDRPENAGMNSNQLMEAMRVLDREVAEENIPGAVTLIARRGKVVMEYAAGLAEDAEQVQRPMEVSSIFDVASLTKVMASLPAVLLLAEQGLLSLKDPISLYVPEFSIHSKDNVLIENLLTHTSGLASHQDMYSKGWSRHEILQHVWNQPLEYTPGTKMVYSDLGFITLGEIVERVTGLPLNQFVQEQIYLPLGMNDTCYLPEEPLRLRAASTEYDHKLGRCKQGEVHDDNAYAMGGVSGHAGLFSTVRDVARYGQMWLNGGIYNSVRLLSPLTIQAAVKGYTNTLEEANRGLGWVLKNDQWDASGDLLTESTYSHTGFTGTSIVCDPHTGLMVVLLTNRVHYGRAKPVNRLRSLFHNAVAASIESESGCI